jgi:hypothetical protein
VPDGDPFAFFQLQSGIIAFVKGTFKNRASAFCGCHNRIAIDSRRLAEKCAPPFFNTLKSIADANAKKSWHPTLNSQNF